MKLATTWRRERDSFSAMDIGLSISCFALRSPPCRKAASLQNAALRRFAGAQSNPSSKQKIRPRRGRIFCGAERGIRTLDTIPGIHDFQSCALDQLSHLCTAFLLHLCYLTTNVCKKQDIFSASEKYSEKTLAFFSKACIMFSVRGALAQLVARNVRNVEVRSSNLLCSTTRNPSPF